MQEISSYLAKIRKEKGFSQQKMAEMCEIPQRTWANYESGRSEPPIKFAIKLAQMGYTIPGFNTGVVSDLKEKGIVTDGLAISLPPETNIDEIPQIVDRVKESDFVIPILQHRLSAGKGQMPSDDESPSGYIAVPASLRRYGKNLAALYVDGDSMEPTLRRGDLIVCDSCGWDGEGIYAIQMDGCGFVKRLARKPGKIVVISDNPKYNSWEEPVESDALRVIGRVHYTLKHVE